MPDKEFKATPLHIIPVLATLLVSISCAFLILQANLEMPQVTLLPETGYGPLGNALLFVCAAGFAATTIYLLLKRGVHLFLRLLMGTAFSVLSFLLVILYSEFVLVAAGLDIPWAVILLIAFVVAAIVVFEIFVRKGRFHGVVVLAFGGAAGTLLGSSIPVISAVSILLLLAVYDIVAVFRGPIGKIAASGLEHLPGTSLSFKDINVGLGDLVFYSMLVSRMLLSFGWDACVAAALGVLIGSFLSFKMVEKRGMFPGLPFSVAFGLLATLLTLLV
jgi:presenilin-like A22 family membrane protease